MTGPAVAGQVSELARNMMLRIARPDGPFRLPTAELRELLSEASGELADTHRAVQNALGQRPYVRSPEKIGIDQRALSRVAPIFQSDYDREGLLLGGLMYADREVARKLLMLVDHRYLLNPDAARTWLRARRAHFEEGQVLRAPSLTVDGGVSRHDLDDLHVKHQKLDVDTLFDNAKETAHVGLHRHSFDTARSVLVLAERGGDELDLLRWSLDALHTVDDQANWIEEQSALVDRRAAAGLRQPLSAAVRAMHAQEGRASDNQPAQDADPTEPARPTGKDQAAKKTSPRRKS